MHNVKCVQCRNPDYDGLCSCKQVHAEMDHILYKELRCSIEETKKWRGLAEKLAAELFVFSPDNKTIDDFNKLLSPIAWELKRRGINRYQEVSE